MAAAMNRITAVTCRVIEITNKYRRFAFIIS